MLSFNLIKVIIVMSKEEISNSKSSIYDEIRSKNFISFNNYTQLVNKRYFEPSFEDKNNYHKRIDHKKIMDIIGSVLTLSELDSLEVKEIFHEERIKEISDQTGLITSEIDEYLKLLTPNIRFLKDHIFSHDPRTKKFIKRLPHFLIFVIFSFLTFPLYFNTSYYDPSNFLESWIFGLIIINSTIILILWFLIILGLIILFFNYCYWIILNRQYPPLKFTGFYDTSEDMSRLRKRIVYYSLLFWD